MNAVKRLRIFLEAGTSNGERRECAAYLARLLYRSRNASSAGFVRMLLLENVGSVMKTSVSRSGNRKTVYTKALSVKAWLFWGVYSFSWLLSTWNTKEERIGHQSSSGHKWQHWQLRIQLLSNLAMIPMLPRC